MEVDYHYPNNTRADSRFANEKRRYKVTPRADSRLTPSQWDTSS